MKSLIGILLFTSSLSAQTIAIGPAGQPALAASRSQILATWTQGLRLHGELIDFNGQVIAGPFDLPTPEGAAIVSDGERFLVYWSNGTNVEGLFVPGNGEQFTILPAASAAVAAFDGTRIIFMSQQGTTIRATPLGDASFDVMQNATLGGVASHDGITAVTWTQPANRQWTAGITFVSGEHASALSLLAALDMTAGFGQTFILSPAVAWNGSTWYVVWKAGRSGREDRYEGRIVSGSVAVIDDDYFTDKAYAPGVLSVGSQFLVTWTRISPASDTYVGRYVNAGGEPGARISLSYQARQIGSGATIALPNGTLVSFVAPLFSDAFIRFGRVARQRVSR